MRDSNELAYAKQIATSLWERHYKEVSPNWKPLDDLMLVLTQIDNMTVGLHGEKEQPWPWEDFEWPSSKQPDEYEAWVRRLTDFVFTNFICIRNDIRDELIKLLLSIPCNPRRKP